MSERNRAPIGIGIPMKHCKYWDKHGSTMIHHLPTGAGFLPQTCPGKTITAAPRQITTACSSAE